MAEVVALIDYGAGNLHSVHNALKAAGATDLHTVNVLEEPEIRANLPRYSNWPTFPQLFINGELIGGCDITVELAESGQLARLVADARKA